MGRILSNINNKEKTTSPIKNDAKNEIKDGDNIKITRLNSMTLLRKIIGF